MIYNKKIAQYALILSLVETILIIIFIGNINIITPFFLGVMLLQISFLEHVLIKKETIFHPMPFMLLVLLYFIAFENRLLKSLIKSSLFIS